MKSILAAALVAGLLGTASQATTVTINETNAPGGDYADGLGATLPNGNLRNNFGLPPAGTTQIDVIGDLRCNDTTCSDHTDAFYFSLGANQTMTSIALDASARGSSGLLGVQLRDTATNAVIFANTVGVNVTNSIQFDATNPNAPLGEGTYNFVIVNISVPSLVNWTASGTVVETSAVPLPAGGLLIVTALGGLAALRRRAA